jgi:hypothetical protein
VSSSTVGHLSDRGPTLCSLLGLAVFWDLLPVAAWLAFYRAFCALGHADTLEAVARALR